MSNKCFRCGGEELPSYDELCPECIDQITSDTDCGGDVCDQRLEMEWYDWEFTDEMLQTFMSEWPEVDLEQIVDFHQQMEISDWLVNPKVAAMYRHHKSDLGDMDISDFRDQLGTIDVDWNLQDLMRQCDPLVVRLEVTSNYDCCNSFDEFDDEDGYLRDVYERVKAGVAKDDYLFEFCNGAYGGSLFCFVCKMPLKYVLEMKHAISEGEAEQHAVRVPAGTQLGFHSSMAGASTPFEKTTTEEIILPVQEPGRTEYDGLRLRIDRFSSYSIKDVFGDTHFIGPGRLEITKIQKEKVA